VAEPIDVIARNTALIEAADAEGLPLSIAATEDAERGATLVTSMPATIRAVLPDRGRRPSRRRQHHGRAHPHHADGMALDNLLVQDPFGRPFDGAERLERLRSGITDALANRNRLADRLAAKPMARTRAEAFEIEPQVLRR
jgi:[protein-PII] uridylyltransferase